MPQQIWCNERHLMTAQLLTQNTTYTINFVKMQHVLSLAIFISVSTCSIASYYDAGTGQVDLGTAEDTKWTAVRNSCWLDAVNGVRALDHAAQNFDVSWTTPEKCRAACKAEEYALAAVEYGHQCWCGNTIAGDAEPVDDAYCNEPCSGDSTQTCGGFGYMNMWVQKGSDFLNPGEGFDLDSAWKPEACYQDLDANHRLLPFQPRHGIELERMRTVEGCISACQGHGYDYAGLENGAECWCGGECPPDRLKGGQCNMRCKGNGKQFCGGQHSLLVYSRDSTSKAETMETPTSQPDKHDQARASGPVSALTDQVKVSAAIPRRIPGAGLSGLTGLPKLPKLPKLPVPLPELPDLGDIVKQIKPAVSNMFKGIQSDVALGKKAAGTILDHISKNPWGEDMDAFLLDQLKNINLDAANPMDDAIEKVKAVVTAMFEKVTKDIAATKTAALLLLDHLPGHTLSDDK
ncbi:Cell wall integrity and stress response component 2 [Gnomoniopsis smithogilvyi]|uniref:Cell wall integrity and stress response component 2 n=1 Tax=Gnomoniopsis smithogilvyi TaxID=1191159 RepID=A0A9W8YR79_9PEZI|nr:Cell wall integrity and stress response component 2 [Gnomoniopsis smithogilvyi]